MEFLISFLEGIITFVSPCLLPMLPIYVTYFLGGNKEGSKTHALKNALGFIFGFTLVFVSLGAFASTIGLFLKQHHSAINIITGSIVVIFGLNYLGIFKIGFLNNTRKANYRVKDLGFFSSLLFGIVFSIGWTPCVGAFLGSALLLASQQGSILKGTIMLLFYSLGLGIPFLLSAVLIDKLKSAFAFIKRNYKIINVISGVLLVIIGILMMTGLMGRLLSLLSF
ncbi:MAG: cytochrome c biogenesis protein CcdA [Oscillospiraceae bacterium]